jgi:hypothetical protein
MVLLAAVVTVNVAVEIMIVITIATMIVEGKNEVEVDVMPRIETEIEEIDLVIDIKKIIVLLLNVTIKK